MTKQRKSSESRIYKKNQMEEIGKKIRDLRNDLGYTQAELARRVSEIDPDATVSQPQIGNVEASEGKSLPSLRLMRALAIALGTSTDFLCGLTDDDMARTDREDQVVKDVKDDNVRAALQSICDYAVDYGMSADDIDLLLILAQRISGNSLRVTPVMMNSMLRKVREVSGEEGENKLIDLLDSLAPGAFRARRRRNHDSF